MTSEYLLLIRNTAWQKDFSAAQIEKVLNEFSAWVERLKKEGKIKVAVPLEHRGKLFESQNVMVDGPFIEAKEAVAGLIIFEAESMEEATEFANSATCLKFGQTLELRPIATEEPERSASRIANSQWPMERGKDIRSSGEIAEGPRRSGPRGQNTRNER